MKKNATFEESLKNLEETVKNLEKGELSLDDSLKTFESGIEWARVCESKLEEAKGKVEALTKTEEGLKTVPFATKE